MHPLRAGLALLALGAVGCHKSGAPLAAGAAPPPPPPPACRPRPVVLAPPLPPAPPDRAFDRIKHFVVLYMENHSFDNLLGELPGAEGLAAAAGAPRQVDQRGLPYAVLPAPPDRRFPANLPNAPFAIEDFIPASETVPDPVHRFYQQRQQINGGRMDRFVVEGNTGGLVMGHYHTATLPLGALAAEYTVCDRFFHAALGGSYLNHIWLVAAASPVFERAPAAVVAKLGPDGRLERDGFVTEDGCFVVNLAVSANLSPPGVPPAELVPAQTLPTIGDRLSARGISWAWYSGGWNAAVAGKAKDFLYHHQPFAYFAAYAEGTPGRAEHLKDEEDFLAAAKAGTLPAVSFVKPLGPVNEHPGYSATLEAEQHLLALVKAVQAGPGWGDTAIIITYDENGGFWDHVAPPVIDEWGPGVRVPTVIVSPFARKGFVDHTVYDTTSILATIERRFGLSPLSTRDAGAADLRAAFSF